MIIGIADETGSKWGQNWLLQKYFSTLFWPSWKVRIIFLLSDKKNEFITSYSHIPQQLKVANVVFTQGFINSIFHHLVVRLSFLMKKCLKTGMMSFMIYLQIMLGTFGQSEVTESYNWQRCLIHHQVHTFPVLKFAITSSINN